MPLGAIIRLSAVLGTALLAAGFAAAAQLPDPPSPQDGFKDVGAFYLRPGLGVRNVGYDTNIFLNSFDQVGDWTATVVPSLEATTLFGHRGRLDMRQAFDLVFFLNTSSQNHVNSLTDIEGKVLFSDFLATGTFGYDSSKLRPSNEINERIRQKISTLGGKLAWSKTERSEIALELRRQRFDYEDNSGQFGSVYRDLNRDETTLALKLRTRLRPKTDITLDIASTDVVNEDPSLGRDAVIRRLVPGLLFDTTAFLQGEMHFGYMQVTPDDPGRKDYQGPTGMARLSYRPIARLRIEAQYDQDVVYSIFGDNIFFLDTRFGLDGSVPVTRRFRLRAGLARTAINYREEVSSPVFTGIREDQIDELWVGWSYALPGRPRMGFRIVRWDRDSNYPPAVTTQYRIVGEATYAF